MPIKWCTISYWVTVELCYPSFIGEKNVTTVSHFCNTGTVINLKDDLLFRLGNAHRYDKIIVMDNGELVEIGSPSELLRDKPDGYFASMMRETNV
jgi:hypothetical protein